MTRSDRRCHVVNKGCKAAPASPDTTTATCYACGNAVCTNPLCSKRVTWYRRRRRVCARCQEELMR